MNDQLQTTIADLVDANHILFDQGIVDGFGHVSVRHPERPDRFFIARSMAPSLVEAADIVELNLDGAAITPDNRPLYLERFIHSEIYRRRPDVNSVVHSHSQVLVRFSIVKGLQLRPVCHMCGFLRTAAPVFEIREVAGNGSDLLISNQQLGEALAGTLGEEAAVLMRGHGSTVVGNSPQQAVFRAIYLEKNAALQAEAMRLGEITYLTSEEAAAAARSNDGQIGRAWALWKRAIAPSAT